MAATFSIHTTILFTFAIQFTTITNMPDNYIEGEKFDTIDYTAKPLAKGNYEECAFNNCNFANTDLSNIKFTDCSFTGCNISMALISQTAFRNIQFRDCKMVGLHFEHCHELAFEVSFDNCILTLSSFYKRKLKATKFSHCNLQEADFSEADLTESIFDHCDLLGAVFDQTNLEKADLRSAFNFSIDPEKNKLKKAKFSLTTLDGLLHKYQLVIEP